MLKITGMDEIKRNLQKLQDRASELEQGKEVSFLELFPDDFMKEYTDYESLQEMFDSSGFKIESPEDFENIPDEEWDEFIKAHSRFDNWEEMRNTAAEKWVSKKLGF